MNTVKEKRWKEASPGRLGYAEGANFEKSRTLYPAETLLSLKV